MCLFKKPERQVIEIGDGVSFRQQSDPAVRKRRVACAEEDGIVVQGFDLASPLDDTKRMPPACRKGTIDLLYHLGHPLYDAVQAKFLFNQTRTQKIIVAIVNRMPDQPTAQIGLSGDCQVGDLKVDVRACGPVQQEEFVCLVGTSGLHLRKDLGSASRAVCDENFPFTGRSPIEERPDDIRTGQRPWSGTIERPLTSMRRFRGGFGWFRRQGCGRAEQAYTDDGQNPASQAPVPWKTGFGVNLVH